MGHSVTQLTQSRYYSPVFNAAVFDGPVRIYFAQHQEPLALKIYFRLQQQMKDQFANCRQMFKQNGQTIFLMLYPTVDSFQNSFSPELATQKIVKETLGSDHVLGVCGPLPDEEYQPVIDQIESLLNVTPQMELVQTL